MTVKDELHQLVDQLDEGAAREAPAQVLEARRREADPRRARDRRRRGCVP